MGSNNNNGSGSSRGSKGLRQRKRKDEPLAERHNDLDDSEEENEKQPSVPIVASSAIRNIAIWRICFYGIMMHEWGLGDVLTPFGNLHLELDMSQQQAGKDYWFRYQQFAWLQELHVSMSTKTNINWQLIGYGLCAVTAIGKELRVPLWRVWATCFWALYSIRFWVKATNFTNHNYLFPLLMVWTILSGGGHLSGSCTHKRGRRDHQWCQAAIVALRGQFAVVYGFASLWKLHSDWFAGLIVEGIFLSFEKQGSSRGIAWSELQKMFPSVFVVLALSGLILDSSMFAVLTFTKPTAQSRNWFLAFTLLFHVFTSITMATVIGYSFPGTCIAGLAVFLPLHYRKRKKTRLLYYDQSLLHWLQLYWRTLTGDDIATSMPDDELDLLPEPWQMSLVLLYTGWQVFMPLRMLLVSNFNFPYNRLGYRYSWTMMLHSLEYGITRNNGDAAPPTVLLLSYFVPTCFAPPRIGGPDVYMPRHVYFGAQTEHPMQDSRSVPMHMVLDTRESAMLGVFPMHLVAQVGDGFAKVIDQAVGAEACAQHTGRQHQNRMGMHATYFAQLNQNGPWVRLIDPTVDLVDAAQAQSRATPIETIWNSLWDLRPSHEFVLGGIASSSRAAARHQQNLERQYPGHSVHVVADRSACLQQREIWFRPMGYAYWVVALEGPAPLVVIETVEEPHTRHELRPGESKLLHTISFEIGMHGVPRMACGDTHYEDVLFAFVFQEAQ